MNCEFQLLYFGDKGYIARCNNCGYYQVAFMSTLLILKQPDFEVLCQTVKNKCEEADKRYGKHSNSIIIQTPVPEVYMFLSGDEAHQLLENLEAADNEAAALSLINMFNA